MSRILILANHYNTLRIFRRELLIELNKLGHEVLVTIPECDEDNKKLLESYGCRVQFVKMERRGMNPAKDIGLFFQYIRLLHTYKPDKVITYTIKCNIYGAYACKMKHIPCYVNVTGLGSAFQGQGKMRQLVSVMYKLSLNKAEKIFFENKGNRDTLVKDGIIRIEQSVVMAGAGVNVDEFCYTSYPSEKDGVRFLFVGRIMKEKGVDELFWAIKELKKKYDNVVFEFIGWYEDNYKDTVESLQSQGYIQFYGFQPNVKPYIEKAHCVVLPSWHEGMSNTLLESAAMGRALITNAIHGCMEAVDDGVNGYLCEKQNSRDLYEKLEQFLMLSEMQRKQMGQAGRRKMERKFSKKDVVSKTVCEIGLNK